MIINVLSARRVPFDRKILLQQKYEAAPHAPGTSNEALPKKYKTVLLLSKFITRMNLSLIYLSKYSSDGFSYLMGMLPGTADMLLSRPDGIVWILPWQEGCSIGSVGYILAFNVMGIFSFEM